MASLNQVYSVRATADADVYVLTCNITDLNGETYDCDFGSRPDDEFGLGPVVRQWLQENQGQHAVEPYAPPPAASYRIAKTTPWVRMTGDEATTMDGVMSETMARLKQIYMAATYLSSDDPLWATFHQMLVDAFGATRADELLAPET